jgi:hypothetical protein
MPPDTSKNAVRTWLVQNIPHKKLLWFCLGFLAAGLSLAVEFLTAKQSAIAFLSALVILLAVLFLLKPSPLREIKFESSRWGIFSVIVLGFGVGALSYRYRTWIIWLWQQFRRINEPHEWVLVSLFLLGVVLGFFVVRNWPKNQQDFIGSLTAVVGAAFVSTILGNLSSAAGLTPLNTFAFYTLGFGLSGTINLMIFSLLVARYSRTGSIMSRSVIDFLYGSDKAKAIDGYFLKNFEEDPNYAKVKLIAALNAYREIIKVEFAKKLTIRKEKRQVSQATSPPDSPPDCSGLSAPPLDYFQLLSIKSKEIVLSPPVSGQNDTYEVSFRKLTDEEPITAEMFRVAISMKWQDSLEYIVAPGQYQKPFPYIGSVAGLALAVKQTIVMDRDKQKKFRSGDFVEGKAPSEADQPRGLHKVDYLSYVVVPMASSFGRHEQSALGVLHVDTKLFACSKGSLPLNSAKEVSADPEQDIYKVDSTREGLNEFAKLACNLYEQRDEHIESLENFRGVIIPLVTLPCLGPRITRDFGFLG